MAVRCLWDAGEAGLKHAVERLLDGVDAVIYVLDFTKLKTASEVIASTANQRMVLQ